jgi:hypothetical protein
MSQIRCRLLLPTQILARCSCLEACYANNWIRKKMVSNQYGSGPLSTVVQGEAKQRSASPDVLSHLKLATRGVLSDLRARH